MNNPVHLTIYCDGAARGNPGPSSYGFVIKDQAGQILLQGNKYLGIGTNNEAEYQGIIAALTTVYQSCQQLSQTLSCDVDVKNWNIDARMDSQFVIEQLNGHYKVRDSRMRDYFLQVRDLEEKYNSVTFQWVPREKNKEADKLANQAFP